jgi:hypothetical protein
MTIIDCTGGVFRYIGISIGKYNPSMYPMYYALGFNLMHTLKAINLFTYM